MAKRKDAEEMKEVDTPREQEGATQLKHLAWQLRWHGNRLTRLAALRSGLRHIRARRSAAQEVQQLHLRGRLRRAVFDRRHVH